MSDGRITVAEAEKAAEANKDSAPRSAGSWAETTGSSGPSIAAHLLMLAGMAWALGLGVPMLAPAVMQAGLWTNSLLAGAILVVLWVAAHWLGRRFRQPVQDLGKAAEEVCHGRLDARVPTRSCPRELAQLAAEFNRMVEKLQRTEAELLAARTELEERVAARTAELADANKEMETFAYSISHDLRAPVRLVHSFSQFLQQDAAAQLPTRAKQHLQSIQDETRHMNEMIDALLELSRVTRVPLTWAPVDLSALAGEIARALAQTTPERQVALTIQPGLTAGGDLRLLRLVLQNLLGNAWKFTRQQPAPQIEFGAREQDGQRVFFVRDNGAGFDNSGVTRLFLPFQRLHTAGEFEGVGVGLATVHRILRRHGGRIWAEGERDRGATFYFVLPDNPPERPSAAASSNSSSRSPMAFVGGGVVCEGGGNK